MSKPKRTAKGPGRPPPGFRFDVHPDEATWATLHALRDAWGGSLGQVVTGVLDEWAWRALSDALELQAVVSHIHPEWSGKPLLTLPREVFMAAIAAQDLAQVRPEGRA